MKLDKKPVWWRSLLVVLSILYLVPEAIFNGQLVSLIGLGTPSADDLEHLELYGRAISGIGVTLLLADFLPKPWVSNIGRALVSFVALFCLVWPSVFYGQKYLVESLLIAPSTPQQRQFAVYSSVLRDALAINSIKINDLDYDPEQLHSSENLTFLALFGGLLYSDNALSDNIEEDKRKIVTAAIQKKAYTDFEQHFNDYSQLYDELVEKYKSYVKGSKKYNRIIASIPDREQSYWQQVEQQVNEGWAQYQQAQKAYIAKASARAQKYGPKIYDYFKTTNKCRDRYKKSGQSERRKNCLDKAEADYRSDILQAGLGYVAPDYWLIAEDVSGVENAASSLLMGVLSGGLYTVLQAGSLATGGDGGIKDKRYKYTSDPDHYQLRFLQHPKFQAMFEEETGYPFSIEDLMAFRSHPHTAEKLQEYFAGKGVNLTKTWTLDDRAEFATKVKAKVTDEANSQWQKEMSQGTLNLAPNLTWVQFQLAPFIQAQLKQRMGDLYVPHIRADLNRKNFKLEVLDPNIEKRTDHYLALLSESEHLFADGQDYEEAGKQALRSVIIPPISMSISLFLICLTLSKLPVKLWQLGFAKQQQIKTNKVKGLVLRLSMPAIILILPVLFIPNHFTHNANSPVNYLLEKIDESSNPLFSYALRWTLHTQPILHPLGLALENTFKIYEKFTPIGTKLAAMDIKIAGNSSKATDATQHLNTSNGPKAKLYITVNTENAKIQIMNIGPRYQPGMALKPGRYDIKISAPGYQTYRQWHKLEPDNNNLSIDLTEAH